MRKIAALTAVSLALTAPALAGDARETVGAPNGAAADGPEVEVDEATAKLRGELVRRLRSKDARERADAAAALGKLGPKAAGATADLLRALDDAPEVRVEVLRALGRIGRGARAAVPDLALLLKQKEAVAEVAAALTGIGGREAAQALLPLLRDPGDENRAVGLRALTKMGADARCAVPELLRWLHGDDKQLHQLALGALLQIGPGEPETIPTLIGLLGKGGYVEIAVVTLLGRSGQAALEPLKGALASKDPAVKLDAVRALWRNADCAKEVVPILRRCLGDAEKWVRVEAAGGLAKVLEARPELVEEIAPGLIEALGDADAGNIAERALKSVPKYLEQALTHQSAPVRARACTAASNWRTDGEVFQARIVALLKGDPEAEVRYSAARALGGLRARPRQNVAAMIAALEDKNSHVRAGACIALKEYGEEAADAAPALARLYRRQVFVIGPQDPLHAIRHIPPVANIRSVEGAEALQKLAPAAMPGILLALDSQDKAVSRAALETLSVLGPVAAPAVPALRKLLSQEDVEVRKLALAGLINIGPEARAALPAARAMLRDGDPQISCRAIMLLAAAGTGADSAELIALLDHKDASVRCHAAVALAAAGDEPDRLVPILAKAAGDRTRFHPIVVGPILKRIAAHLQQTRKQLPALLQVMRTPGDSTHICTVARILRDLGPDAATVIPELEKLEKEYAGKRMDSVAEEMRKTIQHLREVGSVGAGLD